jgi:chaperonin cofactor prefoldin
MKDNELRRMIEESVNAVLMLEKQMEDIRKQMQILQALINEMKPNENINCL